MEQLAPPRVQLVDQCPVHVVLREHVLLDLHCLMEHGIGIVVGRLGTLVGGGRQHILADDDHRQQH
jgi:hypothetical protein